MKRDEITKTITPIVMKYRKDWNNPIWLSDFGNSYLAQWLWVFQRFSKEQFGFIIEIPCMKEIMKPLVTHKPVLELEVELWLTCYALIDALRGIGKIKQLSYEYMEHLTHEKNGLLFSFYRWNSSEITSTNRFGELLIKENQQLRCMENPFNRTDNPYSYKIVELAYKYQYDNIYDPYLQLIQIRTAIQRKLKSCGSELYHFNGDKTYIPIRSGRKPKVAGFGKMKPIQGNDFRV